MNCFLPAQNLKILAKAIHALSRLPGEDMYIEASNEGLNFRTVNSSHSGYLCFLFKPSFFVQWTPADEERDETTQQRNNKSDHDRTSGNYCKISMKSALIFYKNVAMLEKSIESCSIAIDVTDWRLVFELQCKSAVIHRYKVCLLNCARMHATFDKSSTGNIISTPGKLFVDGMQHNFRSAQDEVTMNVEADQLLFRNYVDAAPDPDKVLKTQLRLERSEFEQYRVQGVNDITFCLKELRALLGFVEVYQLPVIIRFDEPGKPIMFSLESDPTFVADLILATFFEPELSQKQPEPSRVLSQAQRPSATTNSGHDDGEIVDLANDAHDHDEPMAAGGKENHSRVAPSTTTTSTPMELDEEGQHQQQEEQEQQQEENNSQAPATSRPRVYPTLFLNYSQSSTKSNRSAPTCSQASQSSTSMIGESSTTTNPDRVILAADSDLEDY